MTRTALMGCAVAVLAAAGCGDDGGGGEMTPRDAGSDGGAVVEDAGARDGGAPDGGTAPLPEVEYDGDGCLTFAGASTLCGFSSDGSVCEASVACGTSGDLSQCAINCEMGTTIRCYEADDVACLWTAAQDEDCDAIEACDFIL